MHPTSVIPLFCYALPSFRLYVCTRHLNIAPVQHIYTSDLLCVFPLSLIINYVQLRPLRLISCPLLSSALPETSSDVFSF
jgi:hypothetical protein